MIANITQGSYLDGLISYNEEKVDEGVAKILCVENCINNQVDIAKGYMLNLTRNSARKDKFFHVSLNFPVSDKTMLSDAKFRMIALEYMNEMGFPEDHPIIAYKHEDTEHPHIHVVTSKILSSGRPINDSHLKRRSQSVSRQLEKRYGLTIVTSKKQERNLNRQGRGLNNKIKTEVDLVLKRYKPTNMDELNRHLQLAQLRATVLPKEDGHLDNAVESNLVYHRIDDEGERLDKGIKSSSLNFGLESNNLEKEFAKNRRKDPRRKRIQNTIDGMIGFYEKLNIQEFKTKLASKNIGLNYKLDGKGNLVGISYTDLKSDTKYSGEKLGQRFKAKTIALHLTTGPTIQNPNKITEIGLEPLKEKLFTIEESRLYETLLLLGYKIDLEKGKVYVSDYKNKTGEGYVLLTDLDKKLNRNIIKNHIDSLKINFTDNSFQKLFTKNRLSFVRSSTVSKPFLNLKPKYTPVNTKPLDIPVGNPGKFQTFNADEHTISDFDKKKKKRKGKGI